MIQIDTRPYKSAKNEDFKAPPPLFCPHSDCLHYSSPQGEHWFSFRGSRINRRHGRVWFYFCTACFRSFSSSSFLVSYYEKVNLSYERILSFAREGISLGEWAEEVKTSPGTLKLRLCKIGCLLLEELTRESFTAAVLLLERIHGLFQERVGAYRVLRELILELLSILTDLKKNDLSRGRPFLSHLSQKKNLFGEIRLLCCQWCFIFHEGLLYSPRYQWE